MNQTPDTLVVCAAGHFTLLPSSWVMTDWGTVCPRSLTSTQPHRFCVQRTEVVTDDAVLAALTIGGDEAAWQVWFDRRSQR